MNQLKAIGLAVLVAVFVACGKDNKEPTAALNQTEITLHYDEEFQFEVKKGDQTVPFTSLTTSSSDEVVGNINGSGLFEANRIGETTIKIVGDGINLSAKVTVEPYQNLFAEPVINFNGTKQDIKNAEKRSLSTETATALLYTGENSNIEEVFYSFGSNGRLNGAISLFPMNISLAEKIAVFYIERYEYIGTSDNVFYFRDQQRGVAVGLDINQGVGFGAVYINSNSLQASAILSNLKKGTFTKDSLGQTLKSR